MRACCPKPMGHHNGPPVWNPGAPYEIEMVDGTEDKLLACHDWNRHYIDDLEGHLPPGAPFGEWVVVLNVWSEILGNLYTEPEILGNLQTEPGPFRARAWRPPVSAPDPLAPAHLWNLIKAHGEVTILRNDQGTKTTKWIPMPAL